MYYFEAKRQQREKELIQALSKCLFRLNTIEIVFIILKLTKLISWSWGIVLIPVYIGLVMFLITCYALKR